MSKHSWWPALVLAAILVTTVAVGIATAATSPSYNLPLTSLPGGAGGGISESASYVMVVSVGSFVKTSSTSASYDLCTGFVCGGGDPFPRLRLPFLSKDP